MTLLRKVLSRGFFNPISLFLLLTTASVNSQAGIHYDVSTPIGTADNFFSTDLNNNGSMVGSFTNASGDLNFYKWNLSQGFQDLGDLGLPALLGTKNLNSVFRLDPFIDNDEKIWISAITGHIPDDSRKSFLWNQEMGLQPLTSPDGYVPFVADINDQNQVAFNAMGSYIWRYGEQIQEIGTSYYPSVTAINNQGQATGRMGNNHAFIWDAENGIKDLGTMLSGEYKDAGAYVGMSINDQGVITGIGAVPKSKYGDYEGFIWDSENGMRPIGRLDTSYSGESLGSVVSWAEDINNQSQIVGGSLMDVITTSSRSYEVFHGFVWDEENGMQDLNALIDPEFEDTITYARYINDSGQIVATAKDRNGELYSVFLNPFSGSFPDVEVPVSPVPEPSVMGLFLGGLGLVGLVARQRRKSTLEQQK